MVVADGNVDELRKRLFAAQEEYLDVLHEPVRAILVGDMHVEDRELATRVIIKNFRHGYVDHLARAGGMLVLLFFHSRKFKAVSISKTVSLLLSTESMA